MNGIDFPLFLDFWNIRKWLKFDKFKFVFDTALQREIRQNHDDHSSTSLLLELEVCADKFSAFIKEGLAVSSIGLCTKISINFINSSLTDTNCDQENLKSTIVLLIFHCVIDDWKIYCLFYNDSLDNKSFLFSQRTKANENLNQT